jgi:hypothetical protein
MASFVLTEATVLVGTAWTGTAPGPANPTVSGTINSSTDWSAFIESLSFDMSRANVDFTNFGDKGYMSMKPGLANVDLSITFQQDAAAASVDAIFGAAAIAGTLLYIDIKPTSAARGTSNPSYVGAFYIASYPAFGGTVGDKAGAQIGFMTAGKFARLTA